MLGCAFFAASPRPYIRTPQATEQYGQVLHVSVARVSLYSRTSARAGSGEKPIIARLEPTSDMPVTFKNWRLVNSDIPPPCDDRRAPHRKPQIGTQFEFKPRSLGTHDKFRSRLSVGRNGYPCAKVCN